MHDLEHLAEHGIAGDCTAGSMRCRAVVHHLKHSAQHGAVKCVGRTTSGTQHEEVLCDALNGSPKALGTRSCYAMCP